MASGAAGSSFTISISLRAEMVMVPGFTTFAGPVTAHADLEIGRGHPQRVTLCLEQHVRQHRQRLTRLDHVVRHLETTDERITIHMHFHKTLRCSVIEEEKKLSSSYE